MLLSGIDIGGTSIKFGVFDEQLNLLQQWPECLRVEETAFE